MPVGYLKQFYNSFNTGDDFLKSSRFILLFLTSEANALHVYYANLINLKSCVTECHRHHKIIRYNDFFEGLRIWTYKTFSSNPTPTHTYFSVIIPYREYDPNKVVKTESFRDNICTEMCDKDLR